MDERGRQLQSQLQLMERNGKALEESMTQLLHMRQEQKKFYEQFGRRCQELGAQEEWESTSIGFSSLGIASEKLASDTEKVLLERPDKEVLQAIAHIQDWGIIPIKKLLEDRDKALKIESTLQQEYDGYAGGTAKAKEKKLRMLSDQKRRVENVNALLDYHMKEFEYFRTAKMKQVLGEIARSQAFMFAKGLELYTAPCLQAAEIQPTQDASTKENQVPNQHTS